MLVKFKLFVLRCISWWRKCTLKSKGFLFGKNCFVDGAPRVRMTKGAQVILEDDVTLISNPRHNPLLEMPMAFQTLTANARIELKAHCGISGSRFVCCNRITIGEYTIIGPGTLLYDSEGHSYDKEIGWSGRSVRTGRPINIGKKCFIGARCIILSGVSIGDNCVIAAGTVVTQDIPAGHKAYGNPAVYEPLPKMLGGPGRRKQQVSNLTETE